MNSVKRFLILNLVLACVFGIHAQKPVILNDGNGIMNIGLNLALYEDKTGLLTIDSLSSDAFADKFTPSTSKFTNYNVTSSNIWSRVSIVNRSSSPIWYLEASNSSLDKIELYTKSNSGAYTRQQSGFGTLLSNRHYKISEPIFKLDIPKDSSLTFYICMNDQVPLQIYLSMGNDKDIFEKYQRQDLLHGVFFGLMLMLIIYNLFIYLSVKDKAYFFYILYVLSNIIFIGLVTGYAIYLPDPAAVFIRNHPALAAFMLGSTSTLFGIVFLNMKEIYKRGYTISVILLISFCIVPLLDLAGYNRFAVVLVQLFGLVYSFISIIVGFVIWRRGYKPAQYYLFAYGFYLAGLSSYISSDLGLLPFNDFTHNALEIGTAVEAIFLSMAVADKLNKFKKDKERAQEQSLIETQKNAELIKQQNVVLEQKVKERTAQLQEQKEVIEEKQKEILDSIHYAKRIQNTLLAHKDFVNANVPDNFILFKPKDIVSGDFYWATKKGNNFYLAVCDSTGHGVPGAFMSLLNISFLNEAINERNIEQPNHILNHVRNRLIENISQEGQKDGMDAILICINEISGQVTYSAANNEPILIADETFTELEKDPMPVGKGERTADFRLFTIEAKAQATLYLYTDGFADQFGGPKGKKFKYKQLNELLLSISALPLDEQKEKLERTFENWKGDLEQVDDVCIIGLRL